MQLEVGKIYEGKVSGITKFGAFVELDKDTTGMVHISEVANTFVNEIKDHLTEGQTVKVKVLNLGDDGKISLSIKKAQPAPQDFAKNPPPVYNADSNSGNADFEDMLSKFKASSEERFSDLKKVIDNKRKSPSRRK